MNIDEGDYDTLVKVMYHLSDIKDRASSTDGMFEPLKGMIELLKSYGQEVGEEVYEQLQSLPEQWVDLKKLSVAMKQNVAPLQAAEVNLLRRRSTNFDVRQHEFREMFRKVSPFWLDSARPYATLDKMYGETSEMEREMKSLQESASLFEVNLPEYKQLKTCKRELKILKDLWDMITLVQSSFEAWNSTMWKEINVEQMEMDCKRFAKDIRGLDKECRAWDAYCGLDGMVKNMVTSLRAVGELQNPSIRERHWEQLMTATKVVGRHNVAICVNKLVNIFSLGDVRNV